MGSGLSGVETPLRSAFLGGGWALPAEPALCGWRHTRTSPFFPQSSPLTALALFLMRWACCGFCGSCPNKATRCVPADLPDTPPGDGFTAPPVHDRYCCRQLCSQRTRQRPPCATHPRRALGSFAALRKGEGCWAFGGKSFSGSENPTRVTPRAGIGSHLRVPVSGCWILSLGEMLLPWEV